MENEKNKKAPNANKAVTTINTAIDFFSKASGIIFVLSMSYNIGYFQYINPELLELFTISDYFDEAARNIWLFVIAVMLFLISTSVILKKKIGDEFKHIIIFGSFTLLSCGYIFLKSLSNGKFWSVISFVLKDYPLTTLLAFTVSASFIMVLTFIIYKIFSKEENKNKVQLYLGIIPILIFLLVVFAPYIIGLIQGYTENFYLTKEKYKAQLVNVIILPDSEKLNNVFIVKNLDKGIIIRQFEDNNDSKGQVSFLGWAIIQQIVYSN